MNNSDLGVLSQLTGFFLSLLGCLVNLCRTFIDLLGYVLGQFGRLLPSLLGLPIRPVFKTQKGSIFASTSLEATCLLEN